MVGSVEQIERDLAALQETVAATAEEFYATYKSYLTALGQATRQQLILASYHLCTQAYPEKFLQLSFSDRQKLQQSLRQVAQQAQEHLLQQLHPVGSADGAGLDPIELLPELAALMNAEVSVEATFTEDEATETAASDPPEATSSESTEPPVDEPLTPRVVARWQDRLERSLIVQLRKLSHKANHLLQQAGIVPKELPEMVLEAASEQAGDAIAKTPNLINLLVETVADHGEDEDIPALPASLTQVVTIHLRLSEIEFADGTVSVWRHKIRNLSAQLNALGHQYAKKQREHAIAEAETAWRSSWFED